MNIFYKLTEAKKSEKKKSKSNNKDEAYLVMNQGNVYAFDEGNKKYVVFDIVNDEKTNVLKCNSRNEAVEELLKRVGIDKDSELEEPKE